MRIRLIEPEPAGHNVYDLAVLPRLGLPLMGRMLADAGHDVRAYCEMLSPVDLADCFGSDLVGISSTTATAPAAYALADLLSEAGVQVVLGGPHVSFMADEALEHAPFVVRGEGERTLVELVEHLERGAAVAAVAGLSYRSTSGEPRHNVARPRATQEQFESLPAPDLSLIVGHSLLGTKPLMTQWGCPFDCEFCSVTAMFSRTVRYRRTDQVLDELAGLDAKRVFFHDDNFVVSKRRAKDLMHGMLDRGLTPQWFAQVRASTALRSPAAPEADADLLDLMHRSGCQMVMIGVETVSDEGLATINKSQTVRMVEDAVRAFHDHGIAVHGMFVAGLDTDASAGARADADFARRVGIDTFQLMVQTPLPGTRLWDQVLAHDRLLTWDWSLFDGHHVVMQPAQMTALELQLSVIRAMRRFYSWHKIVSSGAMGALRHLPDLVAACRPGLVRHLPRLSTALWHKRWREVTPVLQSCLPPQLWERLGGELWLPALRLYARTQISAWESQTRSRAHIELLSSLGH